MVVWLIFPRSLRPANTHDDYDVGFDNVDLAEVSTLIAIHNRCVITMWKMLLLIGRRVLSLNNRSPAVGGWDCSLPWSISWLVCFEITSAS